MKRFHIDPFTSCTLLQLLRKTLSLLTLAPGARISDSSDLSRDQGFIKFLPSARFLWPLTYKLLAKNEDPQTDENPGGSFHSPRTLIFIRLKLLTDNLNWTKSWKTGSLFRREKGVLSPPITSNITFSTLLNRQTHNRSPKTTKLGY